jgi:hypothetical protein
MSEKLTKEMLDALIQEALLQEEFPLVFDIPNTSPGNKADALGRAPKKSEYWGNKPSVSVDRAKAISDGDGNPSDISLEDIAKAMQKISSFSGTVQNFIKFALPTSRKLNANEKALVRFITNPSNETKLSDEQLKSLGAEETTIAKEFEKYIASNAETGVGALDMPYRRAVAKKKGGGEWIDGDELAVSKALPQSTIEVFKKGLTDAGGNVTTYFGKLQKLGDALAIVGGSNDPELLSRTGFENAAKAEEFLNNLPADQLFNTAVILKTMGRLAKETQGSEAGFVFETFLALMMGGAIVGGRLGAADVVAGKKGQRLFSAKQYQDKPGGGQASDNFIAELGSNKDKVMWFISLAKKRANKDSAFSRIDVYNTGISWNGKNNKDPSNYIAYDSDGNPFGRLYAASTGKWMVPWTKEPDFAIPIAPSWADNESIESFDKMFIDTVNKVGDKVKKAIKDMNVMLNRLNDQTKVYIANKAPDSAKKIGDDYRNLKVAITSGIGQIGTAPQKGEFKTQADLEENKMTELDLMVENMVKQFLKGNLND